MLKIKKMLMLINVQRLTHIIPGTFNSRLAVQRLSNKQNDGNQIFDRPNQIVLHYYILYETFVIMN